MFAKAGARTELTNKRRQQFYEQYVVARICEAGKLGITTEQLSEMIRKGNEKQ